MALHWLEEGSPLTFTTAGDAETLVRGHGTRYLVTNRVGDVAPAGARELGVFADDVRHLSLYQLSVKELSLVFLSADESDPAFNRIDLMVSHSGTPEFLDDPQNFLHVQRRQLLDDLFREEIEIVNYLQRPITLELELAFAADFADVFEVRGAKRCRRGTLRPARIEDASVEHRYVGIDGHSYATRIELAPAPTSLEAERAVFRLQLDARARTSISVTVDPRSPRGAMRSRANGFAAAARSLTDSAESFVERSTRVHCDHLVLQQTITQSALDLHALSIDFQGHHVLAAGIPWFCCPFGRDTLLASYEALLLNPDLAASSLRALAQLQGQKYDDFTEEEPGKILHELRSGEMAACKEIPHFPYYGAIDSTPLFVVVAHAAYKVTADRALVNDLAPAIRAALRWIDRQSNDGRGLVAYAKRSPRGLDNQGWKDSRAGVSSPSGRRAVPPIALVEVQGYCVDAYRRGAELLAVIDDDDAATYRERARTLAHVVEDVFWLPEQGRYAFAVDGAGQVLPTIVSNVGHLLWSRLAPPERARETAALLLSGESLSPFGVRTLAAGQPVYNPLSYHNGTIWPHDNAIIAKGFANYDLMDDACRIFEAILAAMGHFRDHRLPELYCGMSPLVRYPVACSPQAWAAAAPFLLLQAVLGIHIDGPRRQLLVRNPRLPPSLAHVEIDGLRVAGSRVSLRLRRVGRKCHVDRLDVDGPTIRTFVELE